ncbi:MAG TPA: DUF4142 domain-containing protein [Acidothermaceae bacterium]
MLRTRLAAVLIPLVITSTPVAFGAAPAPLGDSLSDLHAVSQWAVKLSEMADKRAKSELVKSYAQTVATTNPTLDAKLVSVAKSQGIDITPPEPQTEERRSLNERMKAETTLLGSLEGDAFDKEYMTLVTNTQQSVLNLLKASKSSATDPEVKKLISELTTTIQTRLKTAQDVMSKVYGHQI